MHGYNAVNARDTLTFGFLWHWFQHCWNTSGKKKEKYDLYAFRFQWIKNASTVSTFFFAYLLEHLHLLLIHGVIVSVGGGM